MTNPRAGYSPIIDRKPLKLPQKARVAVWVIINIEEWSFDAPMPRAVLPTPQGVPAIPDVPNYSWFEYGLRIGLWRIKEVLDRHGVKGTVSLNASVCQTYPRIVEECLKSDWEIMGHGFVQRVLNLEEDEREVIRRSITTIREATGDKWPRGWMGPGLAETFDTPDILAQEGIEYVCDWVNDDQPYRMKVKDGELISLPYTLELNDIPVHVVQHHPAAEFLQRAKDQFDTLHREGAQTARIMAISVHPYITGAPHRIGYFDRIFRYLKEQRGALFWRGADILDWYKSVG